jgi:hypothetical protein
MMATTSTPWKCNGPDSTLILGADNSVVGTTLQGEEDYERNYDCREDDAALIVKWVNNGPRIAKALQKLLVIAGTPITDRQREIFVEARAALAEVAATDKA